MRYVTMPGPIQLVDPKSGQPAQAVTMKEYATQFWFDDPRWLKPILNITRLQKVMVEFTAPKGTDMVFEDSDFAILKDIIANPTTNAQGYPIMPTPLMYLQLKSFPEAILAAKDVASHPQVIVNEDVAAP
jgi:hypothetical protein